MDHFKSAKTQTRRRLGFHYFFDQERFSREDALLWSNTLSQINAGWVVFKNPPSRAIPEEFISPFIQKKINVIIDFNQQISHPLDENLLALLLQIYGKWGVRYANLFHAPNAIHSWGENNWSQTDIVETFTEKFKWFAGEAINNGISPILSPLDNSGEYWPKAFLANVLKQLKQTSDPSILTGLILSINGLDMPSFFGKNERIGNNHHGNETSTHQENNVIFLGETLQQFSDFTKSILGEQSPIIIFNMRIPPKSNASKGDNLSYTNSDYQVFVNVLANKNIWAGKDQTASYAPIPENVISCNAFVLSAKPSSNHSNCKWFHETGELVPAAKTAFPDFVSQKQLAIGKTSRKYVPSSADPKYRYDRYILLSREISAHAETLFKELHAYIEKYKPRIGFSVREASKSAHVLAIEPMGSTMLEKRIRSFEPHNIVEVLPQNDICRIYEREL